MKRNDPTFKEMVARIESGELTRRQACDTYDVAYGTLNVWLHRTAGNHRHKTLRPTLRVVTPPSPEKLASELAPRISGDLLEAVNAAATRVAEGKTTRAQELAADPRLKGSTLALRIKREREARGISHDRSDSTLLAEIARDPTRLARAAAILRAAGV